jgi:hypothetical protein
MRRSVSRSPPWMAKINSTATGSRWGKVSLGADPPRLSGVDISANSTPSDEGGASEVIVPDGGRARGVARGRHAIPGARWMFVMVACRAQSSGV